MQLVGCCGTVGRVAWQCCQCGAVNGGSRRACRACMHRRALSRVGACCAECASGKPCASGKARVGTIAGLATVKELAELVAAKDYTIKQLWKAYEQIAAAWQAADAAAVADWLADFQAMKKRYDWARDIAETDINAARYVPAPDDTIPAPDAFNHVMRAIRKNWDGSSGGSLSKGDLSELDLRVEKAGAKPDYSQTPQPEIGSDADLKLFKAADVIVRHIEEPGGVPLPLVLGVAAGLALIVIAKS